MNKVGKKDTQILCKLIYAVIVDIFDINQRNEPTFFVSVLDNLELQHQAMHFEAGGNLNPNIHRQLHQLLRQR